MSGLLLVGSCCEGGSHRVNVEGGRLVLSNGERKWYEADA